MIEEEFFRIDEIEMFPEPVKSKSNSQPDWTDQRVDRLLGWFFEQELPPELRTEAVQVRPVSPHRTARSAGRWLLPLCVAVLIGCVWIVRQLPPQTVQLQTVQLLVSAPPAREVELETTSLPVTTELVSYAGSQNSFEQRSELRWTSQSYFEPDAGVWVEWSAPELVIDVETVAGIGAGVEGNAK